MKNNKKKVVILIVELVLITALCGTSVFMTANGWFDSKGNSKSGGLSEDQFLPTLNDAAEVLDYFIADDSDMSYNLLMTSLKGVVNKTKPRIYTAETDPEKASRSWMELLNLKLNKVGDCKFDLIEKYKDEIKGIVIYDTSSTGASHSINLATTMAGIESTLIVGPDILDEFQSRFPDIPVFLDTRELNFNDMWEVYRYQYDNYKDKAIDRVIVGVSPVPNDMDSGLITGKVRDYAIAVGAFVIWLDPETSRDAELLDKYFSRMPRATSVYMGWWPQEQNGVRFAGKRGVVTLAADYSNNLSVYAGMNDVEIKSPVKAEKPALENKFYIAMILADGDNIQYIEGHLKNIYLNPERGEVPISYTFAPGAYDVLKPVVKYYYDNATVNDNFVSGPSGLGYFYPKEIAGYTEEDNIKKEYEESLVKLLKRTNIYMEKMFIRAITVWNSDSKAMDKKYSEFYAENVPYAYGVTQQENMSPEREILLNDGTFLVKQLDVSYADTVDQMKTGLDGKLRNFTGEKPFFSAIQGHPWKEMGRLDRFVDVYEYYSLREADVEFVTLEQLLLLQMEYMNNNR